MPQEQIVTILKGVEFISSVLFATNISVDGSSRAFKPPLHPPKLTLNWWQGNPGLSCRIKVAENLNLGFKSIKVG